MSALVTCEVSELRAAASAVASVIARGYVPILGNIRIHADNGRIELLATNTDIWARSSAWAQSSGPMLTTVSGELLSKILAGFDTDGQVGFQHEGATLCVSSGRTKYKLPTLSADEFPVTPDQEWESEATVPASSFGRAINSVIHAAAPDPHLAQPYGVYVHSHIGKIRTVAFDKKRLSYAVVGDGDLAPFIIPLPAAKVLARLCGDVDLTVKVNKTLASFESSNWRIVTRLCEGPYFDYAKHLSGPGENPIIFDTKSFLAALNRVALVADRYTRGVKLKVEQDKITLTLKNSVAGEVTEELPCTYDGPPREAGFSVQFLKDALSGTDEPEAELHIDEQRRGLLFGRIAGEPRHFFGPYAI